MSEAKPLPIEYAPAYAVPGLEFEVWDGQYNMARPMTLMALRELLPLAQGLTAAERSDPTVTAVAVGSRRLRLARQMGANDVVHTVRRGFQLGLIVCAPVAPDEWPIEELSVTEAEHIRLASIGLSVKRAAVARERRVTPKWVGTVRSTAERKLHARNMAHAVSIQYALGKFTDQGIYS